LVYNKSFSVIKAVCQEEKAVLILSLDYDRSEPGYPFHYKLTVEYIIEFNKLFCRTIIRNTDSKKIPMGDGWHPYFALAKQIDELQLQLPESFILNDSEIITGIKNAEPAAFYSPKKIGAEHFDSCFKLSENKNRAEVKLTNPESNVLLIVWQECGENKYNYFQLYTPPSRKSIAIEPMTCPPDAFNTKEGLTVLDPDREINLSFGFEISLM
jgi:aldose 1-epimerase